MRVIKIPELSLKQRILWAAESTFLIALIPYYLAPWLSWAYVDIAALTLVFWGAVAGVKRLRRGKVA